jgi:hypothetical protein
VGICTDTLDPEIGEGSFEILSRGRLMTMWHVLASAIYMASWDSHDYAKVYLAD